MWLGLMRASSFLTLSNGVRRWQTGAVFGRQMKGLEKWSWEKKMYHNFSGERLFWWLPLTELFSDFLSPRCWHWCPWLRQSPSCRLSAWSAFRSIQFWVNKSMSETRPFGKGWGWGWSYPLCMAAPCYKTSIQVILPRFPSFSQKTVLFLSSFNASGGRV